MNVSQVLSGSFVITQFFDYNCIVLVGLSVDWNGDGDSEGNSIEL